MHRKQKKTPTMEPKTCQKGQNVGSEYLPTSQISHRVHSIPKGVARTRGGGYFSSFPCCSFTGLVAYTIVAGGVGTGNMLGIALFSDHPFM